jgi:outer membrane lipoprotein SlyB
MKRGATMNATLAYAMPGHDPLSSSMSGSVSAKAATAATKPLWAAIGVLSVCVLSMGATLVHVQRGDEPLAHAALPLSQARAMNAQSLSLSADGVITEKAADRQAESTAYRTGSFEAEKTNQNPAFPGTKSSVNAPKKIASTNSNPPQIASGYPPVVQAAPAQPVCKNCGTIESVTPVTRKGQASGVGAVAGGVLGGVVGNQFGKGNGRAAMTVLGALGGGVAGHHVERNMKKTTVYAVRVRMQDGSSKTIEQANAPAVGARVVVDGNAVRPA